MVINCMLNEKMIIYAVSIPVYLAGRLHREGVIADCFVSGSSEREDERGTQQAFIGHGGSSPHGI